MLQFTDTLLKVVKIARDIPMHLLLQTIEETQRLTGICVIEGKYDQLYDYKTNTFTTT